MPEYTHSPNRIIDVAEMKIYSFITAGEENSDEETVQSFGNEWKKFSHFTEDDINKTAEQYFDIVQPGMLPPNAVVLDVGCGSGRWSKFLSKKVGFIEAIDPSDAIFTAASEHHMVSNIRWTQASASNIPFADRSFDFLICLGVLHHLPDPEEALKKILRKVKPGGYALLYLYYALENRGKLFRLLYGFSEVIRKLICRLPDRMKRLTCSIIAVLVYLPFITLAKFFKWLLPHKIFYLNIPLSYYHDKSFYIIRNDALDRFGTPLQQRFSKEEIITILRNAGCNDWVFSDKMPFWHLVVRTE